MSKRLPGLIAVFVILAALPTFAAPTPSASEDRITPAKSDEPGFVAERAIVRDEKTGLWRKPTATETSDLVNSLRKLTKRSVSDIEVTAADGSAKAQLDGFDQVILARPSANGGTEILCVSSFEEAVEFLGLREILKPQADPKGQGAQQ